MEILAPFFVAHFKVDEKENKGAVTGKESARRNVFLYIAKRLGFGDEADDFIEIEFDLSRII